ncbi:MAG: helix-turn-helix domain-containing protein [Candidatus Asgardarchaeia archaeon]
MSENNEKKKLDEIFESIKKLEKRIEELNEKIEKISRGTIPITRSTRGGRLIQVEATKQEIYQLLKEKGVPMTTQEVSEALQISRSHASALLNELFREGAVNKIRERKIIKFAIPEDENQ